MILSNLVNSIVLKTSSRLWIRDFQNYLPKHICFIIRRIEFYIEIIFLLYIKFFFKIQIYGSNSLQED